jgi:hypothetical protein
MHECPDEKFHPDTFSFGMLAGNLSREADLFNLFWLLALQEL